MENDASVHSDTVKSPPAAVLAPSETEINKNVSDKMANYPTLEVQPVQPTEVLVNGDASGHGHGTTDRTSQSISNAEDNSDCDNLVIDEGKSEDVYPHTNPYFSESIFELSNHYNHKPHEGIPKVTLKKVNNRYFCSKKRLGKNGKPKVVQDYAQFLGLQPAVQFKCSKCCLAGFETLQSLNDHLSTCTAIAPVNRPELVHNNMTNIKVTRKVFLCSACGTYYENWNLFLHMREVHKRFICLYCLGMFSHADKLSVHLISKHNCAPNYYSSKQEFLGAYKEQTCFLMCCDCQTVFNEQDNVMDHLCGGKQVDPIKDLMLNNFAIEVDEKTNENINNQVQVSHSSNTNNTNSCNDNISVIEVCERPECISNKNSEQYDEQTTINDTLTDLISAVENQVSSDSSKNFPTQVFGDFGTDDFQNVEYPDNNTNSEGEYCDETSGEVVIEEAKETRKVPKIKLKLPVDDINFDRTREDGGDQDEEDSEEYHSEDSNKLTMEIDEESSAKPQTPQPVQLADADADPAANADEEHEGKANISESSLNASLPTAGTDVPVIELELEQPLDKFDIKVLIQKCLQATISTCLYCNHARKISVNGKQLGMHAIAEHRFAATVKSITAEELIPESFNARFKDCFDDLDAIYFNLEDNEGGVTFSHIFECFQCRYSTGVHKELYVHNRKMHTKALLLCIMCKTSFYSYSELVCHLCPGVYSLGKDVQFRCCLCVSDELPSAFRLMVHLRKKHHVCDVCMEMCQNQARLSNHVWKHKLHHLCYRCGIAYRNKPDITKHLYWKHGTESVECKRCLMKKWPHVYHFCMPPASFACDECTLSFTRASHLMVHKRLHLQEFPYVCTEENCTDKFISKKLLEKHLRRHRNPVEEEVPHVESQSPQHVEVNDKIGLAVESAVANNEKSDTTSCDATKSEVPPQEVDDKFEAEPPEDKPKRVDVYNLPELNLSESDSSDSEDDSNTASKTASQQHDSEHCDIQVLESVESVDSIVSQEDLMQKPPNDESVIPNVTVEGHQVAVLENVWDDFKNYQANIAKTILTEVLQSEPLPEILTDIPVELTLEEVLRDHDYCPPTTDTLREQEGIPPDTVGENSADHDYCNPKESRQSSNHLNGTVPIAVPVPVAPTETETRRDKKSGKSDSSSGSDSSSCTCGSNCSCSSSSDSSSSSSDSSESDSSSEEGRRRQQARREKRRVKKAKSRGEHIDVVNDGDGHGDGNGNLRGPKEAPIEETDLETTETDTDEEFYDKEPQKLANKLIAEKREKLLQMAGIGPYINGSMIDSRPSTPNLPETEATKFNKKKSKSKKKKKKKSRARAKSVNIPTVAPLTLSLSLPQKHSPNYYTPNNHPVNNLVSAPVQNQTLLDSRLDDQINTTPNSSNTRASKRRRVPNKFYGYSSDEDNTVKLLGSSTPVIKFRKADLPSPKPKLYVPPLTIKTSNSIPTVEPISIKMNLKNNEMRVQPLRLPLQKLKRNRGSRGKSKTNKRLNVLTPHSLATSNPDLDSGTDSNTSSSDDGIDTGRGHAHGLQIALPPAPRGRMPPAMGSSSSDPKKQALYCYCRCPYDEVSEMIGCDADDCTIEWFHFECVNIMVPPKGQWYCPDCRKKKYEKRQELMAAQKLRQQQQQQQQQQQAIS